MSDDIEIQKTIRRLTRRYNAPGHELVNDDGPAAVAIIEALQAEVERLKGVLGWYADENNWRDQPFLRMDHLGRECEDQAPAEIYDDYGTRARSALEAKP